MSLNKGHPILAIPGPSVIPQRVLNAMHRPSANIYEGELVSMTDDLLSGMKKVARTNGFVAIYLANGHGAWEAALRNTLKEGDTILVLSNGFFSQKWGEVAATHRLNVKYIRYGMAADADPSLLEKVLRADAFGEIKAVLAVQSETSSSVRNDIPALRGAMDMAGHKALLMVDCIASLGCDRFEMDRWGVDVAVSASQKGMMNPVGLSFVFFNEKADAFGADSSPGQYWNWTDRAKSTSFYPRWSGSPPGHQMFALRESLRMMLDEEGMEAIWARHATISKAVCAAVDAWADAGAVSLNIRDPSKRASGVTTVNTKPGYGHKIRRWCQDEAGVTLGNSLGFPQEEVEDHFRIGHMGHLNIHMVMGVLGAIETAMVAQDIPHGSGALSAAARVLANHQPNNS